MSSSLRRCRTSCLEMSYLLSTVPRIALEITDNRFSHLALTLCRQARAVIHIRGFYRCPTARRLEGYINRRTSRWGRVVRVSRSKIRVIGLKLLMARHHQLLWKFNHRSKSSTFRRLGIGLIKEHCQRGSRITQCHSLSIWGRVYRSKFSHLFRAGTTDRGTAIRYSPAMMTELWRLKDLINRPRCLNRLIEISRGPQRDLVSVARETIYRKCRSIVNLCRRRSHQRGDLRIKAITIWNSR